MSFLNQDPTQAFKNPNIAPQKDLPADDSFMEEAKTWLGTTAANTMKTVGQGMKMAGQGLDLFSGLFEGDLEGDKAVEKWQKEEEQAKINQSKREERQKQVREKLLTGLGDGLNTTSPYLRKMRTADFSKLEDSIVDMYDTLDVTDGDMELTNNQYGFKNRADYEKYINEKIVPSLIEIQKRKNQNMDARGSIFAYNKMTEQEGSDDLINEVSTFSRELADDANTQAMNSYWSQGRWGMGLLQTGVKLAGKIGYGIDFLGEKSGIGNPNIVSDLKYSKGGASQDSGAIVKNIYSAGETLSDIWDGVPEIISNIIGFKGAGAIEEGVAAADNFVSKLGKVGYTVSQYNDERPAAISFTKNMLSDTFAYDLVSQQFTGKPLTDDDVSLNLMMNLPINAAIGLLARPAITGKALAQQFDIKKTFNSDGTINITQRELELIKQGRSDLAEIMILNRSKLGEEVDIPNMVNIRNITGNNELVTKVARTANNLERIIENATKGTETANQTLQLTTAAGKSLLGKSETKILKTLQEFDTQQRINNALSKTVTETAENENVSKFWNNKVMEQVKAGGIDIENALTKIAKTNPEYADEIALFRKVNNIGDAGLSSSALKNYGVQKLKSTYGTFLKDLYRNEVVDGMKLVDGERVSPIHVFSEGKIKNVETGETKEVSDFFKKIDKTAYQKKALNQKITDDVAHNQEVFQYFNKKLNGKTDTSKLMSLLNRKTLTELTEEEVTLIRAALSNEILQDLASRGKKTNLQAMFSHPAYRIFSKDINTGLFSINIKHLDTDRLAKDLTNMFKSMDELSIVKYLGDVKAQDELISSLKGNGVKETVESVIGNQPDYLKTVWRGFSEMLLRKTSTPLTNTGTYPKISKESAGKMISILQRAFPNIKIEFGKLPEGVKGTVSNYGGKIIIDEAKMSSFTSLHEFGHVWIMHAKAEETELYEKLVNGIKNSKYYTDVKNTYGQHYTEEWQFIDEAIAHAIEDAGGRFIDSLQKNSFMDTVQALMTKIYQYITNTGFIETEVDAIVRKMFNADKPISTNNLAEMDMLQFTKEDFDKNSYFIRHVIQKINEDNLFLGLAKQQNTPEQQEFIFQIINSMIKNTIPSSAMKSTVRNYTHNFEDYMNLVNRDAFTEEYIKSEISKFETSQALRSIVPEWADILRKNGINIEESTEGAQRAVVKLLGTEIIRLAKVSGLKRLFTNGSVTNIIDALKETIDSIKNSDLPVHEKQRALIAQSMAYANTYISDTLIKNAKGAKNMPTMMVNGKQVEVDPNILFQALQVMRMPEFATSDLSIKDYLRQDYIRKSLPKWKLDIKNVGKQIEADTDTAIRLQSSIPVSEIPKGKTVIVTLKGKENDVVYAKYEDTDGVYMTMDKFLKTELDKDTNYLVPTKFFNQATKNPEMIEMINKIKEKGNNIYPVEFTVTQSGPAKYVEQEGFNQLSELMSIKRSGVALPEFKFEHADSLKGMSRLSESTSNTVTRSELAKVLDDTYTESSKAEKDLTDIGVNPVIEPVVKQDDVIHNLGELGKLGEIIRTALRGIIAKTGSKITDNLVTGVIITDDIKREWLSSITGDENLSEIYIGGKNLSEIADEELQNINIDSLVEGLSKEDEEIARARYNELFNASKGESVADEIKKYSSGKEAFDAIIDKLIETGYNYSKVSSIVCTMLQQNPGWAKEIFKSKAISYVPSFDSFVANKIIAPILAKNNVDINLYEKMLASEYDSAMRATFGEENNFRDNDHIIAMFIQTMQEVGILPSTLDVYAVMKNLLPEDRKHLHEVINNYYKGDIWKLIADENTSEYFKSTFGKLKRTFLGKQDEPSASFTNDDIEKGVIEFADEGDDGASIATRMLDEKDADTNMYETVLGAFLPKLKDYNNFEKSMMSPKNFSFKQSKGKPLFELELNLNTWASQPNHSVTKSSRATFQSPQKNAEKIISNDVKMKAFNVFDKRSESTILNFREIDAINMFEKQTFDSPEQLEEALKSKGITITVNGKTMKVGEDVKIGDELLNEIVQRIEKMAFDKEAGETVVFEMGTKNGTTRKYNILNLLNSPIVRTLIEEYTDIRTNNTILTLLETLPVVTTDIFIKRERIANIDRLKESMKDKEINTHINNTITTLNIASPRNSINLQTIYKEANKKNVLNNDTLQQLASALRNIERKYSDSIQGGSYMKSSSNNLFDDDGLNMVKSYLRSLVGGKVIIEDITHFTQIDEVMKNGNSVERADKTIEKNTDLSLNDYKQKPLDTQLVKHQLEEINEKMDKDAAFILTEKVTKISQDGKEYTVTQPIDAYDFTFVYRDIDKKSPTKGQTFEVTFKDGELSEPKMVDEIIENSKLSNTMDAETTSLFNSAKAELCNI